jgi:hypothetical protein
MATLNVGAAQTHATLSAAITASRDGDVSAVQASIYLNDFATVSKDIPIVATMSDPRALSAGIDKLVAGNCTAAQSGSTAAVATVSATANSPVDLPNAVVANV